MLSEDKNNMDRSFSARESQCLVHWINISRRLTYRLDLRNPPHGQKHLAHIAVVLFGSNALASGGKAYCTPSNTAAFAVNAAQSFGLGTRQVKEV